MPDETLSGKKVLLGVSGSIAAYRSADVAGKLAQCGADVHVVMTASARELVGQATFRALTGNHVLSGVFDEPYDRHIAHIHLAQSCDIVLIAPATANVIAKMACGLADDLLTTLLLATTAPVLIAPAMNTVMLDHAATQENLARLRARGITIIEPGEGRLACGSVGRGRLADVEAIVAAVAGRLSRARDLAGVRLMVTAGATREPIDPVRFISNRSSGKMGFAIAMAASARGAEVTLVAAHATAPEPAGVTVVRVSTTDEMRQACRARIESCDVFVGAAAPADYAPVAAAASKIKKHAAGGELTIELRATPDIIAELAAASGDRVVVGFAAETDDLLAHAARKLHQKRVDLIVANDVTAEGAGFEGDTNSATLLWPDGRSESLPLMAKTRMADRILDEIAAIRSERRKGA